MKFNDKSRNLLTLVNHRIQMNDYKNININ